MQLLLRRDQARGINGKMYFKLWSKIELDEDEQAVLKKYKLRGAILALSFELNLVRNTLLVFFASYLLLFVLLFRNYGIESAVLWGAFLSFIPAWFFYDRFRETVYVKDLLHGRYFSCDCIVSLARKEAWLQHVVSFLRQVMQTAKYWDGEEPVDIPALDNDLAKQIIIRGL